MGQIEKWEILRPLGAGGQGHVSLVVEQGNNFIDRSVNPLRALINRSTNDPERVKQFRRELFQAMLDYVDGKYTFGALKTLQHRTDEAISRLQREAEVYEALDDPHLLKILDKDVSEGWIVTQFQPNGSLEDRLGSFKRKSVSALLAIRPVINVLAKMHLRGFTHRDFKPANIFVGRNNEFILGDAGLAFYEDAEQSRVTDTYENVGTRDYMPTWAYSEKSVINPTFDVFSAGKVIWAMIAGRPACRLWYVFKNEFDLTKLFPEEDGMFWVNELLSKCVVEEEKDMKILDGATLLKEIDLTILRIDARAVPPPNASLVGRTCRLCLAGIYEDNTRGTAQSIGKCLRCNRCGHLEFFKTK